MPEVCDCDCESDGEPVEDDAGGVDDERDVYVDPSVVRMTVTTASDRETGFSVVLGGAVVDTAELEEDLEDECEVEGATELDEEDDVDADVEDEEDWLLLDAAAVGEEDDPLVDRPRIEPPAPDIWETRLPMAEERESPGFMS